MVNYEEQSGLLVSLLIAYYLGTAHIAVHNLRKQAKVPEMQRIFDSLCKLPAPVLYFTIAGAKDDLQQQFSFD